jgi:hypothetical protein
MSGVYIGWSGYMGFRAKLMSMVASRYKLDVVAVAASERDGWATEYIRMNRPWDDSVRAIEVQMHFLIEGGLITQIDDFPVDTYAWEKLYTPPRP